jgi:hypothetical protein
MKVGAVGVSLLSILEQNPTLSLSLCRSLAFSFFSLEAKNQNRNILRVVWYRGENCVVVKPSLLALSGAQQPSKRATLE